MTDTNKLEAKDVREAGGITNESFLEWRRLAKREKFDPEHLPIITAWQNRAANFPSDHWWAVVLNELPEDRRIEVLWEIAGMSESDS